MVMKILLDKLGLSVDHLRCLDEVFRTSNPLYSQVENCMIAALGANLEDMSKELYAGGKSRIGLNRQIILGDVIEYIFSGRAYFCRRRWVPQKNSLVRLKGVEPLTLSSVG